MNPCVSNQRRWSSEPAALPSSLSGQRNYSSSTARRQGTAEPKPPDLTTKRVSPYTGGDKALLLSMDAIDLRFEKWSIDVTLEGRLAVSHRWSLKINPCVAQPGGNQTNWTGSWSRKPDGVFDLSSTFFCVSRKGWSFPRGASNVWTNRNDCFFSPNFSDDETLICIIQPLKVKLRPAAETSSVINVTVMSSCVSCAGGHVTSCKCQEKPWRMHSSREQLLLFSIQTLQLVSVGGGRLMNEIQSGDVNGDRLTHDSRGSGGRRWESRSRLQTVEPRRRNVEAAPQRAPTEPRLTAEHERQPHGARSGLSDRQQVWRHHERKPESPVLHLNCR